MFRQFLSTLSLRRATRRGGDLCYLDNIISIHALLAESDQGQQGFVERCAISIHALLAESDSSNFLPPLGPPYFYPRSPCGERRCEPWPPHRTTQFLSTLSLRRATSAQAAFPPGECISIHALLAESDAAMAAMAFTAAYFYPRSPCGERRWRCSCRRLYSNFYPRSPCGERRHSCRADAGDQPISIHALLAESDKHSTNSKNRKRNFYPRSPCGERLIS